MKMIQKEQWEHARKNVFLAALPHHSNGERTDIGYEHPIRMNFGIATQGYHSGNDPGVFRKIPYDFFHAGLSIKPLKLTCHFLRVSGLEKDIQRGTS